MRRSALPLLERLAAVQKAREDVRGALQAGDEAALREATSREAAARSLCTRSEIRRWLGDDALWPLEHPPPQGRPHDVPRFR